jgi:uncharacterized coiled-coil protein SlyX
MTLDIEIIKVILQALGILVLPMVSIVYTWIATRDKDNSKHIKAVEATLNEAVARHQSRIEQMEVNLRHLPRADELADVRAEMSSMQATQESLLRDMQATRSAVTRIETFLLEGRR